MKGIQEDYRKKEKASMRHISDVESERINFCNKPFYQKVIDYFSNLFK
ncbi:hypothetical protein HOD29_04605 [archaeon]|nr:hypothetical protein [archaeon]